MPCRVMGSRVARSVAVAGPALASSARIARRLGSARATNTCSAIASMSAGIEIVAQLGELIGPAVGVAAECRVVRLVGQLREAGLDHRQPSARRGRVEGELDIGTTRVVVG